MWYKIQHRTVLIIFSLYLPGSHSSDEGEGRPFDVLIGVLQASTTPFYSSAALHCGKVWLHAVLFAVGLGASSCAPPAFSTKSKRKARALPT